MADPSATRAPYVKQERASPLPWLLLLLSAILVAVHLWVVRPTLADLLPRPVYSFEVEMSFEGFGDALRIATYLPLGDERVHVVDERIESSGLSFDDKITPAGRIATWSGTPPERRQTVRYTATVAMQPIVYDIPESLSVSSPVAKANDRYLVETKAIPFKHREFQDLWAQIRPKDTNSLREAIEAIFEYSYRRIEPAPFKGYTDALTALRLGEASCNGKSRLFVALARANNIPARLVGGVILESGSKRTSHQWVEVLVRDTWVPFDPLNGHFASLPGNYLELYRGDEFLFTHTRDINFDYRFNIRRILAVAPSRGADGDSVHEAWPADLTGLLGLNDPVSELFLLFPLAALIVTFCRNVIGFRTFGTFLPMLVGAGCRYTGLWEGLLGFVVILAIGGLAHRGLREMRVLVVPRVGAVITVLTLVILGAGLLLSGELSQRVVVLALFPVVILSFAAERMQEMVEQKNLTAVLLTATWTLVVTVMCWMVFSSALLRGLIFHFPELLVTVLSLQLLVGRWKGIRASEYRRFFRLFRAQGKGPTSVLGLNARNLDWISRFNEMHWILVANDKVSTKRHLQEAGVAVPRTLLTVESDYELDHRKPALVAPQGFALKPAGSSQGSGIVLFKSATQEEFTRLDGTVWDYEKLRRHVRDITRGSYADGDAPDTALFEALIQPDEFSVELAPAGILDLRVLLVHGRPVAAMLRLPTKASDGKANLHMGAAGFAVNLDTGKIESGLHNGKVIERHPDTRVVVTGRNVPHWADVLTLAVQAQQAVPLGYTGVDLCLDKEHGPMVIEVNARPGIEIQNALGQGLLPRLQAALDAAT